MCALKYCRLQAKPFAQLKQISKQTKITQPTFFHTFFDFKVDFSVCIRPILFSHGTPVLPLVTLSQVPQGHLKESSVFVIIQRESAFTVPDVGNLCFYFFNAEKFKQAVVFAEIFFISCVFFVIFTLDVDGLSNITLYSKSPTTTCRDETVRLRFPGYKLHMP